MPDLTHAITNTHGLPAFWVAACERAIGVRKIDAAYSVTDLIRPVHQSILIRAYGEECSEDASLFANRLMGTGLHAILEQAGNTTHGVIAEKRLSGVFGGVVVSGATDQFSSSDDSDETLVHAGTVWDVKTCRASAVTQFNEGRSKSDWECQVNAYAELWRRYGIGVDAVKILAVMKDWSWRDAGRKPGYPQAQVAVLELPLWPSSKVVQWIENRVTAHEIARKHYEQSGAIPAPCSPEERWSAPESWAVHSSQNGERSARAHRVFEHGDYENPAAAAIEEADEMNSKQRALAPSKRKHYEPVHRPGEDVRCRPLFCRVAQKCSYYQQFGIKA